METKEEAKSKLATAYQELIKSTGDVNSKLKKVDNEYSFPIVKIANLLNDGIIICDRNGDIIFTNNEVVDIFGKDLKYSNLMSIMRKTETIKELTDKISEKNPYPYQNEYFYIEDQKFEVSISMAEIINQNNIPYYIGIIRKI